MPCEICVSEDAFETMASDLRELRAEVREERREQAVLEGKLERANTELNRVHEVLNDAEIQRIELERQNATLREKAKRRARREKVAWGSAATAVAAGVILFLVLK